MRGDVAALIVAWTVLIVAMDVLVPRISMFLALYLSIGFGVMKFKGIRLPLKEDTFSLAAGFRSIYWAAWWPYYLRRGGL